MSDTPPLPPLPQPRLQPLLHDRFAVLRAPAQLWCDPTGIVGSDAATGSSAIDGFYVSDVRVLDRMIVTVGGQPLEHILTTSPTASRAVFTSLARTLDGPGADPDVRVELTVDVEESTLRCALRVRSRLTHAVATTIAVELGPADDDLDGLKAGLPPHARPVPRIDGEAATWAADGRSARLHASGASIDVGRRGGAHREASRAEGSLLAQWDVAVSPAGAVDVAWSIAAEIPDAVVRAAASDVPWTVPDLELESGTDDRDSNGVDDRLRRWMLRALDDLAALRLELPSVPGAEFLAAGAPWFFTLFGRDSIWAARFLLPLETRTAEGTLRVLAALQGERSDPATAEQPGKIMHELRRSELNIPGEGIALPPLYYGTVDATPLWICLLHDAWRSGLPDAAIEPLIPHLERALAWMRDYGDSDGDGLLEYVDESGRGLSNQGWKDSGDSVQWNDGRLAEGPIALCEVQGYAYEAAVHGAELLETFGHDGAAWLAWGDRLRDAFHRSFWIDAPGGAFPAIALDAAKQPVDSLTSNIGHLLGTGILSPQQEREVADRLVSPQLASGFGLRTLSTDAAGYWPLSYHGGSVWAHDTAIAISGLARSGFAAEASVLAEGLLAAASAVDYRMPELHSGDSSAVAAAPAPSPAACRPQAWSAAAAVVVWDVLREH
jgi:glycogen debranching enzyme